MNLHPGKCKLKIKTREKILIEQGADITIADKYGDRPYTVAVQNKNQELADYQKSNKGWQKSMKKFAESSHKQQNKV